MLITLEIDVTVLRSRSKSADVDVEHVDNFRRPLRRGLRAMIAVSGQWAGLRRSSAAASLLGLGK
jgi:hypothetical protein